MSELRHSIISTEELKKTIKIKGFIGSLIAASLLKILGLSKINKIYNQIYSEKTDVFLDNVFKVRNICIKISEKELDLIPVDSPVIFVSNHPLGAWDGMALIKVLSKKRPDIKFVVNFLLQKVGPLKPYQIGVNPFETHKSVFSSYKGIREMHSHIKDKKSLLFFPAGEVSSKYGKLKRIEDRAWQDNIIKFIKQANVPVVPVFVSGRNSQFFHFLGRIHPLLRTIRLPRELLFYKNRTLEIRFGAPLHIRTFKEIKSISNLGKTLKASTYCLNKKWEESSSFEIDFNPVPIIEAMPQTELNAEIESIRQEYELFQTENYSCFCAPTSKIPAVFKEITRLREITFRGVGEGTGKEADYDKYDSYYKHLFIWDNSTGQIAGAYRIGMGKQIMQDYGFEGFYLNSLFRFRKGFDKFLNVSMELGRSFIVPDYQRKTLPLFLLWKGINMLTQLNPEYKYLIGPVSISSMYSVNSKILMIAYLKRNYFLKNTSRLVSPKIEFKYRLNRHHRAILNFADNDMQKIDRIIKCIDVNQFSIPVLIKKYISLGGKILAFNVDPDFNYAIDGLVILDIEQVSEEVKKSYS
jgi:putative hemolysin